MHGAVKTDAQGAVLLEDLVLEQSLRSPQPHRASRSSARRPGNDLRVPLEIRGERPADGEQVVEGKKYRTVGRARGSSSGALGMSYRTPSLVEARRLRAAERSCSSGIVPQNEVR